MKTIIDITLFLTWYILTLYTDKREYNAVLLETGALNDK